MILLQVAVIFLPQFSVQGLNHSCKASARLVQVDITRPQTLAHGLLDRRAKQMRWMSVKAGGVEVQRASEKRAALLSASSPAAQRSRARGRGRIAHRECALKHRERRRALATNPRHICESGFCRSHARRHVGRTIGKQL